MWNVLRKLKKRKKVMGKQKKDQETLFEQETALKMAISSDLEINLEALRAEFGESVDVIFRRINIGYPKHKEALVLFIDGLVNKETINENIIGCLISDQIVLEEVDLAEEACEVIEKQVIRVGETKRVRTLEEGTYGVLAGETLVLIDGLSCGFLMSTRGWEARAIQEPTVDGGVRGPKESFNETLRTNTGLLRRRIKSSKLRVETHVMGAMSETEVALVYLEGICNPKVLEELKRRMKRIKTSNIVGIGMIEELIEDDPWTPLPLIRNTERPDTISANIIEGRIAILVDGTPFVMTVPSLFAEFFISAEDYYENWVVTTINRWIRFGGFFISLLLPALYVALTTYHQGMIPMALALSIAAGRSGTPFPAVVEALLMGATFEILREAGVRLPRPVGQAISIVGALVIGESAVAAGVVSPIMVIVTALTAIATFVFSSFSLGSVMVVGRLALVILGSMLGFYGIIWGLMFMLIHVLTIRSFGVPFFSPFAPTSKRGLLDTLIRAPWWLQNLRPKFIGDTEPQKQEFNLRPGPTQGKGEDEIENRGKN